MHLTPPATRGAHPGRRHRRPADRGAVAVVLAVAVGSAAVFASGALAVDLGNAYARQAMVRGAADLAALAGAQGLPDVAVARRLALAALDRGGVANDGPGGGQAFPPCPPAGRATPCWDNDGDPANGEITFYDRSGQPTRVDGASRIRVLLPRRVVDFGLARAFGARSVAVTAVATAQVNSPGGVVLPFALTAADRGLTCLLRPAEGSAADGGAGPGAAAQGGAATGPTVGAAPDALPLTGPGPALEPAPAIAAISPTSAPEYTATTFTVTGTGFVAGRTVVTFAGFAATGLAVTPTRITGTTPDLVPAGNTTVTVTRTGTGTGGPASASLAYRFAALAAPAIGLTPTSGPDTGGTAVTITARDGRFPISPPTRPGTVSVDFGGRPAELLAPPSPSAVVVRSPANRGGGAVAVTVRVGSSASPAVTFGYFPDPARCPPAATHRAWIDEPRATGRTALVANLQAGLDHTVLSYTGALTPAPYGGHPVPPAGQDCSGRPDAFRSTGSPPADPVNCLLVRFSGRTEDVTRGLLGAPGGRLLAGPVADQQRGPLGPYPDADVTGLAAYVAADPDCGSTLAAIAAGAVPTGQTAGCLKPSILASPRFAILPVLSVPVDGEHGSNTIYYWVTGFRGFFIDSLPQDPSSVHGVGFDDHGQVRQVKGYAFDLGYLPPTAAASTVASVAPYLGDGPRLPALVTDPEKGTR